MRSKDTTEHLREQDMSYSDSKRKYYLGPGGPQSDRQRATRSVLFIVRFFELFSPSYWRELPVQVGMVTTGSPPPRLGRLFPPNRYARIGG